MAFPYYPAYQNPYQQNYYPTYQQQNQAQQPQQTFTPPTPQASIIWVSGEREAQMYPVAPNNAVTLWSQTEPVVYLKQADATGKPSLKIYDLVERASGEVSLTDKADKKSDEFVSKKDFGAVINTISELRTDIDAIKADVYGIAGTKRSRKNDADDE